MPAQVVGTHFQSVPEPGLFMCMRCHYMETSTGKLTPSVHPFKVMEPATHHHLAAWDEASDMLSTQGSLSGSLNEEDYLYMGPQPEQDLSGLPDDPSSQVRSPAMFDAAFVGDITAAVWPQTVHFSCVHGRPCIKQPITQPPRMDDVPLPPQSMAVLAA